MDVIDSLRDHAHLLDETSASAGLARRFRTGAAEARASTIAAVLVAAAAAALVLIANRGTWFYLDEWDFAVRAKDFSAEAILYPQNQNWHSTVVFVYRALLELFGFNHYVPFRIVAAGLVLGIGALGYAYARRRIGPWWALLALALLIVSPGYEVLLWPFQIGQLLSVVGGLAALVLLDREPTRASRVGAAVLLVVAVASSSAGVPLVALVVYDRLLRPGRRLEALVALPAVIAYGIWYSEYGSRETRPNRLSAVALNAAARRAIDVGDGVMQNLLGLGSQGAKGALLGQIGLVVLVVVVCWRVFGPYSQGRGRVIALAGGLVTYWFLLSWGRPSQAGIEVSGRYLFLSRVLVVLLLVEIAAGIAILLRDERERRPRPAQVLAVGGGAAVAVVAGLALLHNARTELDFGGILRQNARAMRGQVYGVSLLGDERRAGATVFLEPLGPQIPRPASRFFQTLHRFDWSAPTEADVTALPADARARTDLALFATYVPPAPSTTSLPFAGAAPKATVLAGGRARLLVAGPCLTMQARQLAPALLSVRVPATGMAVANSSQTPVTVQGRRYASDWTGPAKVAVAPKTSLVVSFPRDRGTAPWQVRIAGTAARLCSLRVG